MRSDGHERREIPMGGEERRHIGATVFFENEHGEQRPAAFSRIPFRVGLRRAIAEMETWEGEWHIACISTPASIWRDLQGTRDLHREGGMATELLALAPIRRTDLWHGGVRSDARR